MVSVPVSKTDDGGSIPSTPANKEITMGLKTYVKESYNELVHKTTWPSWQELQSSAVVVLVATFIIALIVLVMDFSFSLIMRDGIYHLLR